jgi:hypothetical protein
MTALEACVDDKQLDFVQQALTNEKLKKRGQDDSSSSPNQRDAALVWELLDLEHLYVGSVAKWATYNITARRTETREHNTEAKLQKENLMNQRMVRELL